MVKARFPPKAGVGTDTIAGGTASYSVVFADLGMSPEPDVNYEVLIQNQDVLGGTPTLYYEYVNAKTVTGFTVNIVCTGATGGINSSWEVVRGQDKF